MLTKCYHIRAGINTNMYLEAFHHVFKHIYMKGKVSKRVDRCVHMLYKLQGMKVSTDLLKVEKGKTTHKITDINKDTIQLSNYLLLPY